MKEITRVLIANRGEIAVRLIRSAQECGLETVAVYSDADRETLAASLADEAYCLGGNDLGETYLNGQKIIDIARQSGADALHPGYGFLAENADFARAVEEAGISWIGPSAHAIEALGDKICARRIAEKAGVAAIPGISSGLNDEDGCRQVADFAKEAGFPVVIKRADAGGGRGITRLDSQEDIERYFADHASDPGLAQSFVEKLMERCRHVETQCLRDMHGSFAVVSTRDCSVQRRNQKVIEEAPAPFLSDSQLSTLHDWSKALMDSVDYVGAGTCEFLVAPDGSIYFLEVNPRLQVEHTVSEEVTGCDLVAIQYLIAGGGKLPDINPVRGHAIELRINAEDPADGLMPVTGQIGSIAWPGGPGIRLDTFIRPGDSICGLYDSMIGKITVSASSRQAAIARVRRALDEVMVAGVATNVPLLKLIAGKEDFAACAGAQDFKVYTRWLEESGILEEMDAPASLSTSPAAQDDGKEFVIELQGQRMTLRVGEDFLNATKGAHPLGEGVARRQPLRKKRRDKTSGTGLEDETKAVAPIPATVIRIPVSIGQQVAAGDLLVVLEAMKMEKFIYAAADAAVAQILVDPGDTVTGGQTLVELEVATDSSEG